MKIFDLLPIGSVVRLNGGKKKVMIYGIKQQDERTGKEYDYLAVVYPEGALGKEGHFLFNQSDIDEVLFIGMNDGERQVFLEKLNNFYRSAKNSGSNDLS